MENCIAIFARTATRTGSGLNESEADNDQPAPIGANGPPDLKELMEPPEAGTQATRTPATADT